MKLNEIKPAYGAKKSPKRLGRGIGSGLGKTCARGHKGQKARAGGFHKLGFEGGQMPLQRRLPKTGFRSRYEPFRAEINLAHLVDFPGSEITLSSLKEHRYIKEHILYVKLFSTAELTKPLVVKGIPVSAGAKDSILKAGGSVD